MGSAINNRFNISLDRLFFFAFCLQRLRGVLLGPTYFERVVRFHKCFCGTLYGPEYEFFSISRYQAILIPRSKSDLLGLLLRYGVEFKESIR